MIFLVGQNDGDVDMSRQRSPRPYCLMHGRALLTLSMTRPPYGRCTISWARIQDRLTGEERIGGPNLVWIHWPLAPKPPHNSRLVNQEKRRPGIEALGLPLVIAYPVSQNGPPIWIVAEQGVRQLERCRKRLLRVCVINRYAQHLDAKLQELVMDVPPGRQVGNSRRAPIGMVELDQHHLFTPKIAELEHPSRGGRELEIWRPVAHLYRHYLLQVGPTTP